MTRPLKNGKWELFAQGIAKGLTADAAYKEAGYKPNRGNAASLKANQSVLDRVAVLQGSTADDIVDVRNYARTFAAQAFQVLVDVMGDPKAPAPVRVTAAQVILDRGHGKPTQHIEADINLLDRLTEQEQRTLLSALESIPDEPTKH
jgi:hypothetical protein